MSQCQCEVCAYSKYVNEHIQKLEDIVTKEFFMNMYDLLIHAEMDRDYYKALVYNEWPNADNVIQNSRERKEK